MTTNQFQQNIYINLADDYLSTLLPGNVKKFPVGLTKIFNSVPPMSFMKSGTATLEITQYMN